MQMLATILSTMPGPHEGPRTQAMVEPRLMLALEKLLGRLGVPEKAHVAVITKHTEETCPHYGRDKSGEFDGCTCEALLIEVGLVSEQEIKLAAHMGKARHSGWGSVDPEEAN